MMLSCKTFHLETCGGILLLPKIIEFVSDRGLSMFTWPSSQILSAFVASRSELFRDLRVLELGAGSALPSIVAGLCGVRSVIITERCDEPDILRNINDIIQINCSQSKCMALPLNWGLISETDLDSIGRVDVVLGADVFYSSEAFDSVLLTFLSVLSRDPHAVFFTTYQERSNRRTLVPYLEKYGLEAQEVPKESFMHFVQSEGECDVVLCGGDGHGKKDIENKIGQTLDSFDNISLIKIFLSVV